MKRELGFTLLEALVTLVIVSMVGMLIAQALRQIARVELLLAGTQLQGGGTSLHAEWVRDALTGMRAAPPESPDRFKGQERELAGMSAAQPRWPQAGMGKVRLSLRFNQDQGETQLLLLEDRPELIGTSQVTTVLLSWPGATGRWRYVDAQGASHDQWPPPLGRQADLPQLIMLETGDARLDRIVAAPVGSATVDASRSDAEKL